MNCGPSGATSLILMILAELLILFRKCSSMEVKYDQLSQETLVYIEELRDALYDADDLLDEFATLVRQKLLMEDHNFVKKVRLFFSRYNQLGVAYNMSHGVKKIVKKLEGIASRHSKFGLNLDHKAIEMRRREETCSTPDIEIIGRGEDVEEIVGILLNPHAQRDVSYLSIVGMGGLGKTALAQLVYKHKEIKNEFSLRLWICVSDHDPSKLDVKTILAQILKSATGNMNDGDSLDVVVSQLQKVLAEKRFLIVLDDLWTESRYELEKLVQRLVGGKEGSRVIVTTRSKETAEMIGNGLTYELKGLSDENSWRLFQQVAFERVRGVWPNDYSDFIIIGKDIVKLCANVPIAIRVIGSLLYKQDKGRWLSVQAFGLANLREDQNVIMKILKYSYQNLDPPLKSCFSYCSLFPKDFRIRKKTLLSLWLAQGYVVPLAYGQSVYDASEEYFSILLRRCFLQDVRTDEFGEIVSFKLHDLMHDVALEVAQKEICSTSSFTGEVGKVVRHVSLNDEQYQSSHSFTKAHIRTYINVDTIIAEYKDPFEYVHLKTIVSLLANYRCLRTLSLNFLSIKVLPTSIGKLIHLRFLDLSYNRYLEVLPKSITKLNNLQTLNLNWCESLKELPKNMNKLFNLGFLGLDGCDSLMFMPPGMSKLTDLHTLSKYVVGSNMNLNVEIEGLKGLKNLGGDIEIVIHVPKSGGFVREDSLREGAYLRDKERLNKIFFEFKHEEGCEGASDYEEELLGALQPHSNLKKLSLEGYKGVMPRWVERDNLAIFLPNLVNLTLISCSELRCLTSLGKLQHLKTLWLLNLLNLEYIECHPSSEGLLFLPSLEQINLRNLPKLKEWRRRSGETVGGDNSSSNINMEPHQSSLIFSQLNELYIDDCPELVSFPGCPRLKLLKLGKINEGLRILCYPTKLGIDNLAWLQHSALPLEYFQSLTVLTLSNVDIECLTEIGAVLRACSSSLRHLQIWDSPKLRSLSGGLRYLKALEKLWLVDLSVLDLGDEESEGDVEGDDMPWGSLSHTLLEFRICGCKEVKTWPKWMRKLTSLRVLRVSAGGLQELKERWRNPNGEDWPNIQHIPHISVV